MRFIDTTTAPGGSNDVDPAWAWAPYEPDARRPWDLPRAGHLFRRAAFGADWGQLEQAMTDGPQRTIDKLLRPEADLAAFDREYDDYEAAVADSGSADSLRAWWLRRMIHTPHPLREKMTLFWHGHFAISNARVKNAQLMRHHLLLLRRHALGRFEPLLEGVTRDPALLVGLDCRTSRKANPDQNLPRALMECYGPGPGHYTESDVTEAARAFTGHFVLQGEFRFIRREHDTGRKSVLEQEGNLEGEDVVRIVLAQPATARRLVRKLYRWFISESSEPAAALVAPLAESFAEDYDVARLVETMLRSNLFFSPAAYRRRVKSPVEFALGIVQALEGSVSTTRLGQDLAALGQNLCHPPTVNGWHGGHLWINRVTLMARNNLALGLLSGTGPYGDKLDPGAIAEKHGFVSPEAAARFLLDLFVQGDVKPDVREALPKTAVSSVGNRSQRLRRFAHCVVTLPEFQLA